MESKKKWDARQTSLLPGVKQWYYSFLALGWGKTGNAPKLGTTGMFLLLKTFPILAATALFRS